MTKKPFKITYVTEDGREKSIEAEDDDKLTTLAYAAGIEIKQSCGGKALCADCVVKILENPENAVKPMEFKEKSILGTVYHITHERLACQSHVQNSTKVLIMNPAKKNETPPT